MKAPNLIVDLTFAFSLKVIVFTEQLEAKRKYNMANQLFRSGTSIGQMHVKHKVPKVKLILYTNVK